MRTVSRTDEGLLGFLSKHRIETLNMAGVLENEPKLDVFVNEGGTVDGVLLKGPYFWYLHTESDTFLEEICGMMAGKEGFYSFSGLWKPVAERIKARFPLVWEAPCDLYVLPDDREVPALPGARAQSVELDDAEVIDEHYTYRHSGSLEKIRTCIRKRNSSAIYVDGKIACWLLVHEDNSLGIMYTLEEHRRRGYAVDVTLGLIAKQRAAGKTPFLQIRDNNAMSPDLARKCGFESYGKCEWFGVMSGIPEELKRDAAVLRRRTLGRESSEISDLQGITQLAGRADGTTWILAPGLPAEEVAKVHREVLDRGWGEALWIVNSFDPQEGMASLVAQGALEPAGERICLARFMPDIRPDAPDPDPVEPMTGEAWLEAAARIHDRGLLEQVLFGDRDGLHLVGNAQGVAGLLQQEDDDGFELAWCTCLEPDFLRRVMQCARSMNLLAPVVHVTPEEAPVFEALGFMRVYTEAWYRRATT